VSEEDWDMSDTITNMGSEGKRKGEEKSLIFLPFFYLSFNTQFYLTYSCVVNHVLFVFFFFVIPSDDITKVRVV
jgi:hypothetical protein